MTYTDWFQKHSEKHTEIVKKLFNARKTKEEVIQYFNWSNMKEAEPSFCGLYKDNKKCHPVDGLNCFFCGCPYYRFKDTGIEQREDKIIYSVCSIDSKFSTYFEYEGALHLDCSDCKIPHTKQFALKHFDWDWENPMKNCIV